MKTMTIRNVPDEVAEYLSAQAAGNGRSINTTTVAILCKAAGHAAQPKRKRDLSWLAGSWTAAEGRKFDAAVGACRQVEPEAWK